MTKFRPPSECPVCGEPVPRGARACPECGADERSGWDEAETRSDGLDLPADAYGEIPAPAPGHRPLRATLWSITAVLVILALGYLALRG